MIRIFGPVGTEVHMDGRRFECVALTEAGVTWRSKCPVCETPVFVETKDGYLPPAKRCAEHRGKKLGPPPPSEVSDEEAAAIQGVFPTGMMSIDQMLPVEKWVKDPTLKVLNLTLPQSIPTKVFIPPAVVDELGGQEKAIEHVERLTGQKVDLAPLPRVEEAGFTLADELAELSADDKEAILQEPSPEEVWRPRLRLWLQKKMWMERDWGPPPGKMGCLVPPEFMENRR